MESTQAAAVDNMGLDCIWNYEFQKFNTAEQEKKMFIDAQREEREQGERHWILLTGGGQQRAALDWASKTKQNLSREDFDSVSVTVQ